MPQHPTSDIVKTAKLMEEIVKLQRSNDELQKKVFYLTIFAVIVGSISVIAEVISVFIALNIIP